MNEITLDWDLLYDDVKSSVSWSVLKKFVSKIPWTRQILIRKSSNGNVHVKIILNRNVTLLEQFEIRAVLRDDVSRIRLDLLRLWEMHEDIERLWDAKLTADEIKVAGDWLTVYAFSNWITEWVR